ncbi:MAG TPA: MBL fold metallo-hydrolase [Candidatus Erysipelatoclostridium merdavium]|uniref:MBL fold metallo-hydrolase n=1 Tax=Candidatus Erysipelatoclostridium merdavium TaxID=2838566 RepID=A0A9D1XJM8_9FIRM|nr:MBL fold metallo-hydrolase [Candidatus Erysipelatoclostridium merdavium]
MKIKTFVLGVMQTNCYIVSNDENHCMIIDPGAQGKKVAKYLEENELVLDAILLTHGHFDHIGAVDYLYDKYHCPIYIHHEDIEMLTNPRLNLSYLEKPFSLSAPVTPASEHMEISGFKICWFHLPGHCPGASMIYLEDENVIFSGDVLFNGSIGRFDFPNSSKYDTLTSIEKIKTFNFDATLYPGHGPSSTLKSELLSNPYLQKS